MSLHYVALDMTQVGLYNVLVNATCMIIITQETQLVKTEII